MHIIFITGFPQNGKTTFSVYVENHFNFLRIETDLLFNDSSNVQLYEAIQRHPVIIDGEVDHFSIANTVLREEYLTLKIPFFDCISKEIQKSGRENIVIDGFGLYPFRHDIQSFFKNDNIIVLDFKEYNGYDLDGNLIIDNKNKEQDFFNNIINKMKMKDILKKSTYQSFDFLGDEEKSSKSKNKYTESKIDSIDLKNKSYLDIGCNAGYFLFKNVNKNAKKLVGIDFAKHFIDIALEIKETYFKDSNVELIQGDIFKHSFNEKFDLITAISIFHYFVDRQNHFLNLMYSLLNKDGILILEVEETPKNDFAMLEKAVRPADKHTGNTLDYPNNKLMIEWCKEKFNIVERYKSVNQVGSLYDRYYYKLIRI